MKQPALFIGRFQPFHNGHLLAIKKILSKEKYLYIVVGSAQSGYTPKNPFTTAERIVMLQRVLEQLDVPCSRYLIIPVPDVHNFTLWVNHVKQYVPPFGVVYTGSETGATLFSKENIAVEKIVLFKKKSHSGTEIRRRIRQGEEWKSLVPSVVAEFILEVDGITRLQSLSC
ncbi:MAG: nicotinamide-nucleotide adenylyltransferase [Promethearchaeota archaeon]